MRRASAVGAPTRPPRATPARGGAWRRPAGRPTRTTFTSPAAPTSARAPGRPARWRARRPAGCPRACGCACPARPGSWRRPAAGRRPRRAAAAPPGWLRAILRVAASTHQHRFLRHVEEVAVARLGLAEAPVVALHRLLRLHQALLQRAQRTEVAREHQVPCLAPGRRQAHGQALRDPFRRRGGEVDLAPARHVAGRVLAHLLDLRPRVRSSPGRPARGRASRRPRPGRHHGPARCR